MFTKKNTPPKLQRTLDGVRKEKDSFLLTNPDGPPRRRLLAVTTALKSFFLPSLRGSAKQSSDSVRVLDRHVADSSRNRKMRHFDRRVPEDQRNLSETSTWLSKILSQKRIIGGGIATLILVAGVSMYFSEEIKGATYGWTQSSWIGGQTSNIATHTNNQENWTEFASKDANIDTTSTPGEVKIVGVNNSWIQTSDADFNAGTNDGTVVSGGAVSSLRPPGASCTSHTQCTSYSCTGNLCGSDNGCGVAQDADGNRYGSIWVGTQCWLNRNLNVGTMLASASTLPTNNGTIEKWCYDNNSANCISEGGLYHWSEAMNWVTTEGAQGICPTGWHIPTDAEQNTLDQYLKDTLATCNASRSGAYDCISAGTKLKVNGTSNMNITLAGNRYTSGTFVSRGTYANLWSSSVSGSNAWYRNLNSGSAGVGRSPNSQAVGFSVRCLKN